MAPHPHPHLFYRNNYTEFPSLQFCWSFDPSIQTCFASVTWYALHFDFFVRPSLNSDVVIWHSFYFLPLSIPSGLINKQSILI